MHKGKNAKHDQTLDRIMFFKAGWKHGHIMYVSWGIYCAKHQDVPLGGFRDITHKYNLSSLTMLKKC